MVFKAGMTHVVRDVDRPGSRLHKREVVEAVTIMEAPPMVVVGLVGYMDTPTGLRALTTVWAEHLNEDVKRRFYKNWYKSKKKAFTKYAQKFSEKKDTDVKAEIERIKKTATVVRVLAHTQPTKTSLRQRKAHLIEIQINGGTIAQKTDFAYGLFEQPVNVSSVFEEAERVDTIGVSKGHGIDGVVGRWGVSKLPRKTHRGLRKIACVGSWHPARVKYTAARAGQRGYHHRTERNKAIYRIGLKVEEGKVDTTASTGQDLTAKGITPVGGFGQYGVIRNDWVMIKGAVVGTKKRVITLRKPVNADTKRREPPALKFIDTASKFGHGRFQTAEEKARFYGRLKKDATGTRA